MRGHRLPKKPDHLSGRCKSPEMSGPSIVIVRMQKYGLCKIPEKQFGESRIQWYGFRPHKTREHRARLYKMPRYPRSYKPSVSAIRPSTKAFVQTSWQLEQPSAVRRVPRGSCASPFAIARTCKRSSL
jgi:hypothetical protein